MHYNLANNLVEAGRGIGLDMRLDEMYSGRGMFGATTSGIIVDSMFDLAAAAAAYGRKLESSTELLAVAEQIRGFRQDKMGQYSLIVY
jgi:hypothetical protein